jgi:VCBS repeat-containing protein
MKSIWVVVPTLLLSCTALAADPRGRSEKIELHGKQYVRVDKQWFVESSPAQWFEVVPGVVTIKFEKSVTKSEKSNFFRANKVERIRSNRLGAIDIRVPRGQDPVTFVAHLSKSKLFEYVEVNTYGRYDFTPDDTQFTDQWGLNNTGQTGGTVDADVDAPEAWDLAVALPDVAVAVLDSGVDYDHEDLECNIWVNPGEDLDHDGVVMDADDLNGLDDDGNGFIDDVIGWDFAGSDNDPDPANRHGTHVAGIIGACGDNAMGVIGVAGGDGPGTGTKMIPLLVGNAAPDGSILDDAILYAADNGARVIAMSLSVGESQAIKDALTYAYDTVGVFIVNSSGNDDSSVTFPGVDTHVMAVGATNHDDVRADPDLGLTWGSNFGPELEVAAPGVDIMSTVLSDGYNLASGTSMASPHVSGTAALMFSFNPLATNQEVRDCITGTAEDEVGDPAEDTPGRDDFYGFGRLNTADALSCIQVAIATPPVAENDDYDTDEDTILIIPAPGVLSNDSDVNGDPLTAGLDTTTTNGFLSFNADGSFSYTPDPDFCGADGFTYHADDGALDSNIATVNINVDCVNDAPVATNNTYTVNEDTQLTGNVIADDTGAGADGDVDGDSLSIFSNSDVSHGVLVLNADGSFTYDPNSNYCGSDSFAYVVTDNPSATPPPLVSNEATVSISVTCVNDPPEVTELTPDSQSADYSDNIGTVTITVQDVDDTSTTLAESNEPPASASSLALTATGCAIVVTESPTEDGSTCTFEYDGQVLDPGDNVYNVLFTPWDADGAGTVTGTHMLTITPEMATATLYSGNPIAEEVEEAGGDATFELYFSAIETLPDLAGIGNPDYGNLNLMVPFMELVPVGPGGPEPGECSIVSATIPADGYAQIAVFECVFEEVPVNTYEVFAWVDGASDTMRYYTSAPDDSVLVVFDPSLGFTTGGGWFYWPGTANPELLACGEGGYSGDRTSFGYNMKYNKKMTNIQGSLLLQRKTVDENCEGGGKYRVKSNALDGLSIGDATDDSGDYGWAAFGGKSVFSEPDAEAEGNHPFLVYVEDHSDQGGDQAPADEFWIQIKDKDGIVVLEVNGPDSDPAGEDGSDGDDAPIESGNIIVPHATGKR